MYNCTALIKKIYFQSHHLDWRSEHQNHHNLLVGLPCYLLHHTTFRIPFLKPSKIPISLTLLSSLNSPYTAHSDGHKLIYHLPLSPPTCAFCHPVPYNSFSPTSTSQTTFSFSRTYLNKLL